MYIRLYLLRPLMAFLLLASACAKAQTIDVQATSPGSFSITVGNVYSWYIQELVGTSWVHRESGHANSPKTFHYSRSAGTYTFRLYNCYPVANGCSYSPSRSVLLTAPDQNEFDTALWRLASRVDRYSLGFNATNGQLNGGNYAGLDNQHWRIQIPTPYQYQFLLEQTGQCLATTGNNVYLANCSHAETRFDIIKLRARSEAQPALYRIRATNTTNCLRSNGLQIPTTGACDNNARWYIEPTGFGERNSAIEYEIHALLLVKPQTNVPGLTQGSLPQDLTNAAQTAFTDYADHWMTRITDGRVKWRPTTLVSSSPITSLTLAGGNYLPAAINLTGDVQTHIPRGLYDTVQVFFTPGNSVTGGWGWGPGASYASNYTLWATVNGKNTTATQWLIPTNSEPVEVFIHEAMHGYDGFAQQHGVPLPDGLLHASTENRYTNNPLPDTSFLHWYSDYWLGKVIAADDTYRGYGPRLFRRQTPRAYALNPALQSYKVVQATSGKCFAAPGNQVDPANNVSLILTSQCDSMATSFVLESNGMLKHMASGKCVHPHQGTAGIGVTLVFFGSCAPEARLLFQRTPFGSLKHIQTGLCVHPQGGSPTPSDGTPLVFWNSCDEARLKFDFIPKH